MTNKQLHMHIARIANQVIKLERLCNATGICKSHSIHDFIHNALPQIELCHKQAFTRREEATKNEPDLSAEIAKKLLTMRQLRKEFCHKFRLKHEPEYTDEELIGFALDEYNKMFNHEPTDFRGNL